MTGRLQTLLALTAAPLLIASASQDRISAAARIALATTGARGLAIATIDRGRITQINAFGVRDSAGSPLTVNSVMYGASLTKAVVGYLTVQLASEKRLDLDRPIAALLPHPIPSHGNFYGYGH